MKNSAALENYSAVLRQAQKVRMTYSLSLDSLKAAFPFSFNAIALVAEAIDSVRFSSLKTACGWVTTRDCDPLCHPKFPQDPFPNRKSRQSKALHRWSRHLVLAHNRRTWPWTRRLIPSRPTCVTERSRCAVFLCKCQVSCEFSVPINIDHF